MSNKTKIAMYRDRQNVLAARGFYNSHIIAKLERKIRALQNQEAAE